MFLPVKAVLIHEQKDNIEEIMLDISPVKNEVFQHLKGPATFIGQWPHKEVVIMKCRDSPIELQTNENTLPIPFNLEVVQGPILLVRMDAESNPQDFTLKEYQESMPHPSKPIPCRSLPRRSGS